MEDDLLDVFLSAAAEQLEPPQKNLQETNFLEQETNLKANEKIRATTKKCNKGSLIHGGDTDSSDDEDNRCFESKKYNEYGRDIKFLLTSTVSSSDSSSSSPTWRSKLATKEERPHTKPHFKSKDVYADPIFGLRIINPLVSSAILKERMIGREVIPFYALEKFVANQSSDKNWVIAGVIANKSTVRTSQKGTQYLIWTLTDLKGDIKTISMFLFRSAYKEYWKTAVGTVVGVLNPSIFDKSANSKDIACLSVDNAQKIMVLGQSKDLGTCKSIKKNGEKCTAIVNLSSCEFCVFHIKQEYQKCSKRQELQSGFTGRGLTALRNKVLGKDQVFYAGKLYTAIPAKKNSKQEKNDQKRLSLLKSGISSTITSRTGVKGSSKSSASSLERTYNQRIKDLELLKKLGGINNSNNDNSEFNADHSAIVTAKDSKQAALDIIAKLKDKPTDSDYRIGMDQIPKLTGGDIIDLNTPSGSKFKLKEPKEIHQSFTKLNDTNNGKLIIKGSANVTTILQDTLIESQNIPSTIATPPIAKSSSSLSRQANNAKMEALNYIKQNGVLKKTDPNSLKTEHKKRRLNEIENFENPMKKNKIEENGFISERFRKMMNTTSSRLNLLEQHDLEEQEKYFNKLEIKERMEEKMATTYKVPCKAVKCLKCKYTNFSAAELCKTEKHPLKVFDAIKRFFMCSNCKNRMACLEIVPIGACKNCGSTKWTRTGMMKEKIALIQHNLSIRGGEQTFVNSVATDANINLLVPDNE